MKRGLVTVPSLSISPEAGCLAGIVWRLGIYCQAKLETWHLLPSKVGDLATTAMVLSNINKGALVFNVMMPSNKSGDLAPTVLELSNGLCVMQCDLSGQVNV